MPTDKFSTPASASRLALTVPCLLALSLGTGSGPGMAQDRIYRCSNNEYTNNSVSAAQRGCKLVEGGNITIVSTTPRPGRPAAEGRTPSPAAAPSPAPTGSKVDTAEQRNRDSDARAILESELRKAEAKQEELLREYRAGDPEKRSDESRNYQKYLDRVADLKAQIARNENDIAGIKREIARMQPVSASR